MNTLLQDVRFALRMMLRNPGVSAVVVLTLALGIGANTAVFSVVHGVALRPLGFSDPEQLVQLRMRSFRTSMVSVPNVRDWREQSQSFADMGIYYRSGCNVSGLGRPRRVSAVYASASLLPVLGFDAKIGRVFGPNEGQPGTERVVLMSERFWRGSYGTEPNIVGQTLLLDGTPHTVLGVLPQELERAWGRFEVWLPWAKDASSCGRGNYSYQAVGRLKPDVSVAEARAELETISAHLAKAYPGTNRTNTGTPRMADFVRFVDAKVAGRGRSLLMALSAAVACVLLMVCVNVANLLLARCHGRRRELALRSALGAGRRRLVRQTMTECLVLSLAGGTLGVLLAFWSVDGLAAVLPGFVSQGHEISSGPVPQTEYHIAVDGGVLLFALAVSMVTAVLFGVLPAGRASHVNVNEVLKDGGPAATVGRARRLGRDLLIVGQLALALALVTCAGLMIRSFAKLQAVDVGVDAPRVLTARVALDSAPYRQPRQRVRFFEQAVQRIRENPGVTSAAAARVVPLAGRSSGNMSLVEGYTPLTGPRVRLGTTTVTPGYFETMGIPLLKGRDFDANDTRPGQQVIIVNERAAREFWPNGDAIGRQIRRGNLVQTVVGVVGDVRQDGLGEETSFETYRPYAQDPWETEMTIVARITGDPLSATAALRQAVVQIDPDLPLYQVQSMEETVSGSLGGQGTITVVLTGFAVVALALAAVGLYGVMAYSVSERTQEMGIRMALGAQPANVLSLVLRRGALLTLLGIGGGLALAVLLGTLFRTLIYGISPADPATLIGVSILLGVVSLAACYIPARRATKVDPIVALRYE
jgi:putative ABC transport system permease protein